MLFPKEGSGDAFFEKHLCFLGGLSPEEISHELNSCDIFISLSTFSHEDFGLAAAEALESGLSAILTKWGGHSSFKNYYPDKVRLIDLVTSSTGFEINYESFKKVLLDSFSDLPPKTQTPVLNKLHIADLYWRSFSSTKSSVPRLLSASYDLVSKMKASENEKYSIEVLKKYAE